MENSVHKDFAVERLEHLQLVSKLLRSRLKGEALRWLSGSEATKRRSLGDFRGAKSSVQLVNELYEAGAKKVIAVEIKTTPSGSQRTEKLILELPSETGKRASVFKWCKRHRSQIGYSPEQDGGEQCMYILLA
jgi:hypothetical protein